MFTNGPCRRDTLAIALVAPVAALAAIMTMSRSVGLAGEAPHPQNEPGQAEKPYGIPARVPWTTSHISGAPEPPPPFETRRAFPHLVFKNPLDIAFAPGLRRVFVAEQFGKVYSFPDDDNCTKADLFADLPGQVHGWEGIPFCRGVSGIYGITFDPQFQKNHYVYICYILDYRPPDGHPPLEPKDEDGTHVSRFTVTQTDPPTIDPGSEKVLLKWYAGGHNGGCIKFGPDGYLYISTGDAADPDPPDKFQTGQDIGDLLSSVLRIDVEHPTGRKPYSIPADNPFVNTPGARPEVYCYGLRNPWRMNFDRKTGNLWVADVGWELWESVYCAKPAGNYGWSIVEGPNPVHPDWKPGPTPITPPEVTLSHAEAASITGGIVYRGKKLPELYGSYIFGDWQTRRLWAANCAGAKQDKLEPYRTIGETDQKIVAFGEDPQGEPIIVDHGDGGLWRIVRNEASKQPSHFPRKLSETGLFTSARDQTPQPGVVPFSINAPQWVDGATGERWVAVPGTASVSWGKGVWNEDKPTWPTDSVLVRTLSLGSKSGDSQGQRKVETQLLHFDGKQWRGYSYRWNDQQTDADLVDAAGDETIVQVADASFPGGARKQPWHFASRAQCMTCHTTWGDYALAFNAPQLDRIEKFGEAADNQVRTFRHVGLLLAPPSGRSDDPPPSERAALTNPYDSSADLNERARSYLHVNCSSCHRFGGGGSALFDVRKEMPLDKMNLVNVKPNLGAFGIDDAKVVCAGDPARSVLLYRASKLGTGRMPHIGSDLVDEKGLALIRQWIASLAATAAPPPTDPATVKAIAERDAAIALLTNASTPAAQIAPAVDRLLSSTCGALALLNAIEDAKLPATACELARKKGQTSPQDQVRDLFRRFNPAEQSIARLGSNINPARLLALHGDASRGRQIFFTQGGAGLCSRCHIVNGQGTDLGPDLSHIASKYNRADLLDNILNPSKTIAPGYATYIVRTTNSDIYSGFLVTRTDREVVLKDQQLKLIHIPAADVQRMVAQPISAMPEGLLGGLDARQAADLLEFVGSLK